jgi:two-component system nitrate/nitrite response regulator NarL
MKVRIVIADDHTIVRTGIKTELSHEQDFEVVGEAVDGDDTLKVVQETNPDVLLLDIQMPGMKAMDLVRKIKTSYKQVKVLVLSAYREQAIVIGVMKAGADGYILKDEDIFSIPTAIRKIMAGLPCISPTVAQVLVNQVREPVQGTPSTLFTEKEKDILRKIAEGMSNKDIAKHTGMALRTVEAHIGNIYGKLGISSRTKAVLWAKENGLI